MPEYINPNNRPMASAYVLSFQDLQRNILYRNGVCVGNLSRAVVGGAAFASVWQATL